MGLKTQFTFLMSNGSSLPMGVNGTMYAYGSTLKNLIRSVAAFKNQWQGSVVIPQKKFKYDFSNVFVIKKMQ